MSRRNVVSLIRNLQRRGARRREPEVVLEGVRLIEEALAVEAVRFSGSVISPSLQSNERGQALATSLRDLDVPCEWVSDEELRELADTDSPQGVIAVVTPRAWTLGDIVPVPDAPVLIVDGVQDPGNVGTLIRTAFALGAAGVVTLPGTAAVNHPKVLRAAAGAIFRVPVVRVTDEELQTWLDSSDAKVIGLEVRNALPVAPCTEPVAVIVGNEGAGMREYWRVRADVLVSIPTGPESESLNVAVAAGIVLYEVTHAR